jgi:hypothetical protein
MFEATSKARQRCPSCGHRFEMSPASLARGLNAGTMSEWSRETNLPGPPSTYGNGDRLLGGVIFGAVSALVLWAGVEMGNAGVMLVAACGLALVAISAALSGLWSRYEDLHGQARNLADLPRAVVWTVARILAVMIELLPV